MISAKMVKELRDKTGAGMMDCKKALTESNGDIEKATDLLREKGLATAAKKSGRVASEGLISTFIEENKENAAIIELNCETDFVSMNPEFKALSDDIAEAVAKNDVENLDEVNNLEIDGEKISVKITDLIAKLGENMNLRRYEKLSVKDGLIASYVHMGGKIGVLVKVKAENTSDDVVEVARDVAMHVAAINPEFLDKTSVDEETIEREKEIYKAQAENEGKPAHIAEKMVTGRLNKFFKESCLVSQEFVKNPDLTVEEYVKEASKEHGNIEILDFVRFETGEGIEKEVMDFADEVKAQMKN